MSESEQDALLRRMLIDDLENGGPLPGTEDDVPALLARVAVLEAAQVRVLTLAERLRLEMRATNGDPRIAAIDQSFQEHDEWVAGQIITAVNGGSGV